MKPMLFSILFLIVAHAYGQDSIANVYFFPGTGSDERIFSKILLPEGYSAHYIQYSVPEKKATMADYAALLAQQIDTTATFMLIGVSLGGMICTELTNQLSPSKTIIISSAKCRLELPWQYRIQRYVPINKLFGPRFLKAMSFVAQAVVEPDRNKQKAIFDAMLSDKDPLFLKRCVNMIFNWERETYPSGIIHFHGTNDHTLPLRNINPSVIVPGGSHMMTLTRGEEINALILENL
ncbi:MAG: alpha/beta hydrolase [Saprospiraceae bacterium]|nr:alpha/beta hydrolase [Saprospiraceae bacterium]